MTKNRLRLSRIQVLRKLLVHVDDLDKKVRVLDKKVRVIACLSIVAILISLISVVFQISLYTSYM